MGYIYIMQGFQSYLSRLKVIGITHFLVKPKLSQWLRLLCWVVLITFGTNVLGTDAARAWTISEPQNIIMPAPGALIPASQAFSLPTLKAISINPNDPFKIDFVVDRANQGLSEKDRQEQINLLIKYFLSFLTLPEEDLWVNLSPYEKNHIIPSVFETTNAGRDMLVQDYILKQLASSLTYPDHEIGKIFWKRVFNRVKAQYGSNDIPVTSFNKVWVVPDRAVVYEENGSAYISESRLKVLTEEDYLSIAKNKGNFRGSIAKEQNIDHISSEITREIIIPELTREVNEGKYFAALRQMYNSLILAIWFKKRYRENLIGQVYVDQKKTVGIALGEKRIKDKIYAQYLKAFKKGVYNYIREEEDPLSNEVIPRKYFSGGFSFADAAMHVNYKPASGLFVLRDQIVKGLSRITVALDPVGISKKNLISLMAGLTLMGGVRQANASAMDHEQPLPSAVQGGSYTSIQPLIALQKALNKVDGNTGSLLGNHSGAMGYEKVQRIIDAIDYLPSNLPIWEHAQELKKALLNPEFYAYNLDERNQGILHGDYFLTHSSEAPKSKTDVDNGIRLLKKEIANLLSSTHYIYTAPSEVTPWASSVLTNQPITLTPAPILATPPAIVAAPSIPAPAAVPATIVTNAPVVTAPVTTVTNVPVLAAPAVTPTPTPQQVITNSVAAAVTNAAPATAPVTTQVSTSTAPATIVTNVPVLAAPAATPTSIPQQVITNSVAVAVTNAAPVVTATIVTNVPVVAAPLVTPSATASTNSVGQVKSGGDSISITNTVSWTPALDELFSPQDGIVTDLNPNKIEYNKGDIICFILDSHLRDKIDLLTATINNLKNIKASPEDIEVISQKLARLMELKQAGAIKATHYFRVEHVDAQNGVSINKNENILTSFDDRNRGHAVFNVPSYVNNLSRIYSATIQGVVITNIESAHWGFSDNPKIAQINLIGSAASPILSGHGYEIKITLGTSVGDQKLNSVVGQQDKPQVFVRDVKSYPVFSKADGQVKFLVQEGQWVFPGQTVAMILRGDGRYMPITVSSSGKVISLMKETHASWYKSGDELMRIKTSDVYIGDIKDLQSPVFSPTGLTNGYPVLIRTLQGINMPGFIDNNPDLYSPERNIDGNHPVVIHAVDKDYLLETNVPVKIIFPANDKEKQDILEAMGRAREESSKAVSAGAPPPPLDENETGAFKLLSGTNVINAGLPAIGGQANVQPVIVNINSAGDNVDSNHVTSARLSIDVQESVAAQGFAKANQWSLTGGVYLKNGQIYYSGGFMGILGDIAAGAQMGSANGIPATAAAPLIMDLGGKLRDILTHKVAKQTEIAKKTTEIIGNHMFYERSLLEEKSRHLIVDLGVVDEKIKLLNDSLAANQVARSSLGDISGQSIGADGGIDLDRKLEDNIQSLTNQLSALQLAKANLTLQFNKLTANSNEELNRPVIANLPWGKSFSGIDVNREIAMRNRLLATNSPNFQIMEVEAQAQVARLKEKLQKTAGWATLNVVTIDAENGNTINPMNNVLPSEDVVKSSQVGSGPTVGLQGNISIKDSVQETKMKLVSLEREKQRLNAEQIKWDLATEFETAVTTINAQSRQIQELQKAYESVELDLKLAQKDSQYLPYQLVDMRKTADDIWQKLLDAKAEYLKAEVTLRKLGVWGAETSTQYSFGSQVMNSFQTAVQNAVAGNGVFASTSFNGADQQQFMSPGIVTYDLHGMDASVAWAYMSPAGLQESMKQTLTENPDIKSRAKTLDNLFEHPPTNSLHMTIKDKLLDSNHEDVSRRFFNYMVSGQDRGIRFLIGIVNEGELNNNTNLVHWGFQALNDALAIDINTMNHLNLDFSTPDPLFPRLTEEAANKVITTFLVSPEGKSMRDRVLQSNAFSSKAWAGIYANLEAYQQTPEGQASIGAVKEAMGLVHDAQLRSIIMPDTPQVFNHGLWEQVPRQWAVTPEVMIEVEANATTNFLNGPNWRDMKNVISPSLYNSAVKTAEKDVKESTISSNSPIYAIPSTRAAVDEMTHFKSLGDKDRSKYIEDSHNPADVNRTLQVPGDHRGFALDQLMRSKDLQDHLLPLQTLLDVSDTNSLSYNPELASLIRSKMIEHQDTFNDDIAVAGDSTARRILGDAYQNLYDNDHDPKWLQLRTRILGLFDLYEEQSLGEDHLSKSAQKARAILIGMNIVEKANQNTPKLSAGQRNMSTSVNDAFAAVRADFLKYNDPERLARDIDGLAKNSLDAKVRAASGDVQRLQKNIAQRISGNDQYVPWYLASFAFLGVFIVGARSVGWYYFKRIKDRHNIKKWSTDRVFRVAWRNRINGDLTGLEKGDKKFQQNLAGGDEDDVKDIPPPNNLYNSTEVELKQWYDVRSRWLRTKTTLKVDDVFKDIHIILHNAEYIVAHTRYTPELIWDSKNQPRNERYRKTLAYTAFLALDTLRILTKHKNFEPNSEQKKKLKDEMKTLLDYADYADEYSRGLSFLDSIEKVLGYGLVKAVRVVLLYERIMRKTTKRFQNIVKSIPKKGNLLVEGLYQDEQAQKDIEQKSNETLAAVINGNRVRYESGSPADRRVQGARSRVGRWLTIVGLGTFIVVFVSWVSGLRWIQAISGGISFFGSSVLFLNVWNFLKTHQTILDMQKNFEMNELTKKVKADLDRRFGFNLTEEGQSKGGEIKSDKKFNDENDLKNIRDSIEDGKKVLAAEMQSDSSSFNMIVIDAQDKDKSDDIRKFVSANRGTLFRKDAQVLFINTENGGSGNAEFDAIKKAKAEFIRLGFEEESWNKSKVLRVFVGKELSYLDKSTWESLLRRSIINGYRAARNSNGAYQGGHIVINTRDAYFGPMPVFTKTGVVMLTAKVNEEGLKIGSWVHSRMKQLCVIDTYKIEEIGLNPDLDPDLDEPSPERIAVGAEILTKLMKDKILSKFSDTEVKLEDGVNLNDTDVVAKIKEAAKEYSDRILDILKQSTELRHEVTILEQKFDVVEEKKKGRSYKDGVPQTLEEKYNTDNRLQKQYTRSAGITFLAPNVISVLTKIVENDEIMGSLKDFHLRFIYDILYPIVIGNTNDSQITVRRFKELARDRAKAEKMRDKENDLYNLYLKIYNLCRKDSLDRAKVPPINKDGEDSINKDGVESFQPNSRTEVSFFMAGLSSDSKKDSDPADIIREREKEYREKVMPIEQEIEENKDFAQLSSAFSNHIHPVLKARRPGGIDLTSMSGDIQFKRGKNILQGSSSPMSLDQVLLTLRGFKGFEFQVIQYQPISNPIELFSGVSMRQSGPWFLSKARSREYEEV